MPEKLTQQVCVSLSDNDMELLNRLRNGEGPNMSNPEILRMALKLFLSMTRRHGLLKVMAELVE